MSLTRRFLHDQSGAVAALTGVALVGLVAIGGLAYDVSRAYALRAELESAVDDLVKRVGMMFGVA